MSVEWSGVLASALVGTGVSAVAAPYAASHWARLTMIWDKKSRSDADLAAAISIAERDLIELHRHFDENDTVLRQALAHIKSERCVLSRMNVMKLDVPNQPLILVMDKLALLPDEVQQALLFYLRLLPNITFEIEEAGYAARSRDYEESLALLELLLGKNEYMLKVTIETYRIVRVLSGCAMGTQGAERAQAIARDDIVRRYPRPIDKNTPKPLHYYRPQSPV